jgi:hypothetical protein
MDIKLHVRSIVLLVRYSQFPIQIWIFWLLAYHLVGKVASGKINKQAPLFHYNVPLSLKIKKNISPLIGNK